LSISYDNPTLQLFFRSACKNVRNIGDGNLIALGDKVATASVTLFNVVDPDKPKGEQEHIRFAEPCPGIEWAGSLAYNRAFRVNKADRIEGGRPEYTLDVVMQNPEASQRSFTQAVQDPLGRLQDAGLWFRRVGSSSWS